MQNSSYLSHWNYFTLIWPFLHYQTLLIYGCRVVKKHSPQGNIAEWVKLGLSCNKLMLRLSWVKFNPTSFEFFYHWVSFYYSIPQIVTKYVLRVSALYKIQILLGSTGKVQLIFSYFNWYRLLWRSFSILAVLHIFIKYHVLYLKVKYWEKTANQD